MKRLKKELEEYFERQYADGYRQGCRRRLQRELNGQDPETMANNSYEGDTFHGLFGYMDGMEDKMSLVTEGFKLKWDEEIAKQKEKLEYMEAFREVDMVAIKTLLANEKLLELLPRSKRTQLEEGLIAYNEAMAAIFDEMDRQYGWQNQVVAKED